MSEPSKDCIAVWQVLCRYCHYVDRRSMSDVAGLFHPEAEFIFPPNPPAAGREAILESLEEWDKTARRPTAWLRHRIDTPMIEVDGDRATSVCYMTADFLLEKKNSVQALIGRYEDEFIRYEGRWMISRREIIIHNRIGWGRPAIKSPA